MSNHVHFVSEEKGESRCKLRRYIESFLLVNLPLEIRDGEVYNLTSARETFGAILRGS